MLAEGPTVIRRRTRGPNRPRVRIPLVKRSIGEEFPLRAHRRAKYSALRLHPVQYLSTSVVNSLHPFARAELIAVRDNLVRISDRVEDCVYHMQSGGSSRSTLYTLSQCDKGLNRTGLISRILISRFANFAIKRLLTTRELYSQWGLGRDSLKSSVAQCTLCN